MKDILKLSLKEITQLMAKGEVSPLTVMAETMNRIKDRSVLNAFITTCEDSAMRSAEESTKRIVQKNARPLEGVPFGVKDLFCTKGVQTTSASKILEGFVPTYESTVTQKLFDNGVIMVGKTNMDEFAMGSSNETSYFGSVKNPWNEKYVPGGSSGGSAAAVADYLCYAALGSDTGGSVRQPASFCGIVGMKPTYGRCSRFGMIPYASSFDQAGVMARSVDDTCIVLDKIMGYCTKDSRSVNKPVPTLENVPANVKGMKIGYIVEHMDLVEPYVAEMWHNAMKILKSNGAEIIEFRVNDFNVIGSDENPIHIWLGAYFTLTTVEAFSNFAKYDGIRYGPYVDGSNLYESYTNTRDQFGSTVRNRMVLGAYTASGDESSNLFKRACIYRDIIKKEFKEIFTKVDAILSPTSPHEAFELDRKDLKPHDNFAEDMFTVIANLIGSPAISIPGGLSTTGMPLGIHLMSDMWQEEKIVSIAKVLEKEIQFKLLGDK